MPQMRHGAGAENPHAARVEYTCPMHPEIVRTEPGHCPICGMALEPRTVTGTRRKSRTCRHDAAVLGERGLTTPLLAAAMADMLPGMPVQNALPDRLAAMDGTVVGDSGGALGWLAIFPTRMGVDCEPLDQHVHADRHGNRRRIFIQSGGDDRARDFPRIVPGDVGYAASLFRSCGGDRHSGASGTSSRTPRQKPHWSRHPSAAGSGSQKSANRFAMARKTDIPLEHVHGRGPPPGASRRKNSSGWSRARRQQLL